MRRDQKNTRRHIHQDTYIESESESERNYSKLREMYGVMER